MGDNFNKEKRRAKQYSNYNFSQFNGQNYPDALCSKSNNITFNIDGINEIHLKQNVEGEVLSVGG